MPTGTITSGAVSYINIPQAGIWLIIATLQLNYTGTLTGFFGIGGLSFTGIGLAFETTGASSASASHVASLAVSTLNLTVTFTGGTNVTIDPNSSFKAVRIG